ncbi:hypothetical protein Tco_0962460 [Tanacetum coccineum]
MPTKIELTLEQSQQGVSNDVLWQTAPAPFTKTTVHRSSLEPEEDQKVILKYLTVKMESCLGANIKQALGVRRRCCSLFHVKWIHNTTCSYLKLSKSFNSKSSIVASRSSLNSRPSTAYIKESSIGEIVDSKNLIDMVSSCTSLFSLPERSHKSPTAVLFDVDTGRISIRQCEMLKSTTQNVLARAHG